MPRLTLVLDRKPVQVFNLDQSVIRIGRGESMDVVIDNVSVSRRQAEIRDEDGKWVVRDLGSANGTFVNGERLTAERLLRPGDEVSFGKFSIFFEKAFADARAAEPPVARGGAGAEVGGTLHLSPDDLARMQRAAALKRQAQLQWEAAGQRGTQYLEGGAILVGRTDLCDVQVPAGGPRQHVLLSRRADGFEVRNLTVIRRMRVNGQVTRRASLKSGDVIEIAGLRLTFMDEVR